MKARKEEEKIDWKIFLKSNNISNLEGF